MYKGLAMSTKVYIKTFGCQMNFRDSEFVMGILLDAGFRQAASMEKADVIIFNSCSVRKHAEDRLFSNIGDLASLKKRRPSLIVGLMGCTAQSYKADAFERAPLLDFVCGTGNESDLPEIVGNIIKDRCRIVAADKVNEKRPELFPAHRGSASKTFVSISEGCDNFCSYCIVPYVRGRERSRDTGDIIREVKGLAARGFKEITLLGQNVNSYEGDKEKGFIKLLERLDSIDGIERIRFMTSHPKDASEELFRAMRDLGKVCEHLHLPLQSGSDRILKLMNRKYTRTRYSKLVDDYKKILPEGAITTDIVVGFPSETDRDFTRTVDVMKAARFDSAFTFKYSPRPPAKSARLKDNVSETVKEKRLKTIIALQCKICEERNVPLIGRTVEVLVDGSSGREPGKLTGRTRTNKTVVFKGAGRLAGKILGIKIESVAPYALKGRIA
ncbi:MAG: tRNA (N6-isopentenyl adenosine(37)-C2)-methylthiotransferase MiaB [Candidatus Omnitrophica bacterium]|nr:tRNA (N6-isopentenyl adenosine(37)-C2)-methylthiotransferase MiaB [Candidatus Omnitrophota bacterium]